MPPIREENEFFGYLCSRGLRAAADLRALIGEIFAQHGQSYAAALHA